MDQAYTLHDGHPRLLVHFEFTQLSLFALGITETIRHTVKT